MSKIALTPSASGTGVFTIASPATSTDRTLTLPDEAGTVLTTATAGVPIGGPAFSAYQVNGSVNQSISSDVWTKAKVDTEEFDTNNNYDTSTYRFTPTVAGYYQVNGCLYLRNSSSCALKIIALYKNGSPYKSGISLYLTGSYYAAADNFNVSSLVYLNGSTDYVELYGYISSSAASIGYGITSSYFNAAMVRSAT